MTKNEIKDLFKLDELANILKLIEGYKDVPSFQLKEVGVNGNTYDILKQGDSIIIKDHNNSTGIGMTYRYYESDNKYIFFNSYDESTYNVLIDYRFQNGHIVKLDGNMQVVGNSLRNVTGKDLMENLNIEYITESGVRTKFNWNLEPGNLKVTPEGASLNGIVVNPEKEEIVSINGEQVPTLEEIHNYNRKFPKAKANDIIHQKIVENMPDDMSFKDMLEYIDKKDEYLKANCDRDYSEALYSVLSLVYIKQALETDLSGNSISNENLSLIGDVIEDEVRNMNSKIDRGPQLKKTVARRLGSN